MEGVNTVAILAAYLALLAFGATSLVAFGLLVARHTKAARILFAAGLLGGAVIVALAMFSFFAPEFHQHASAALIFVVTLTLFLSGAGQFVAALQSARIYAAALACTAAAIALVASPLLIGDWSVTILGDYGLTFIESGLPLLVLASLLPAVASALIAVGLPQRADQSKAKAADTGGESRFHRLDCDSRRQWE
jgi:hypothetical protein